VFKNKATFKTSTMVQMRNWHVIYCKANTEKSTACKLTEKGFKVYCPTQVQVRQWSDRKKKVEVPVLPSMILIKINDKQRNAVFEVPQVHRYLFFNRKLAVVREEEVATLQHYLSGEHKKVSVTSLQEGDEMDMDDLGFKGKRGVIKKLSKNQCWIHLESLGFIIKVDR
jgi:transcription antitermination factor NusG